MAPAWWRGRTPRCTAPSVRAATWFACGATKTAGAVAQRRIRYPYTLEANVLRYAGQRTSEINWFLQAEHDLRNARHAREAGDHDWACFAAQQASEKAVKALHQARGQEAWDHSVLRLLRDLPVVAPETSIEKARSLDAFCHAGDVIEFVGQALARD